MTDTPTPHTPTPDTPTPTPSNKGDAGASEVQAKVDKENEQGFRGTKVDPLPNSAYSIQTGPDSPSDVTDHVTRAGQTVATGEEK